MKNTRCPFTLLIPLALATVALTGCSSSSDLSGMYYGDWNLDSNSKGTVVVDGGILTMTSWDCDAGEVVDSEERVSVGLLNDDRTQVTWGEQGEHFNTGKHQTHGVVASDDRNVLQINKGSFYREGTEAADEAFAEWQGYCTERAATDAERKANQEAEAAEAAATSGKYETAATGVLDGVRAMSASELGQTGSPESIAAVEELLKKNSITVSELMEYLEVNQEALGELIDSDPIRGEAFGVALQMLLQQ